MSFSEQLLISDGSKPFQTSLPLGEALSGVAGVEGRDPHLSSLDNYQHNCTLLREQRPKIKWRPSQVRCYNRVRSGCVAHRGEKLRFLTLTTAQGMKRTKEEGFRALKERIRRATPYAIYKGGKIKTLRDLNFKGERLKGFHWFSRHYYPGKNPLSTLTFQYTRITTTEGVSGVFHILYFGDYLPQSWVSSSWEDLTGTARVVDIRGVSVQRGSEKRVSIYAVNQYVSTGQTEYVRFSNSWGWCFLGFLGKWETFRREFSGLPYEERWERWENYIVGRKHPPPEHRNLWDFGMIGLNPRFNGEGVIDHSDFYRR